MQRNTIGYYIIIVAIVVIAAFLLNNHSHSFKQSNPSATAFQPNRLDNNSYPGATAPELVSAPCKMRGVLPDPNCTPGVANPQVTQENIDQTICVPGFTKVIRPPTSYTDKLKERQMVDYGFTDSIRNHEEDHLISLELGGAPADPKNLWPEPHASPNAKDKVEDFLHTAVCSNKITLQEAQQRIATNWTTAKQGL